MRGGTTPAEAAFARLMTPTVKYWVCKMAPADARRGDGVPRRQRLRRGEPRCRGSIARRRVNAIWEGSGNVMALDVLRVLSTTACSSRCSRRSSELGPGRKPPLTCFGGGERRQRGRGLGAHPGGAARADRRRGGAAPRYPPAFADAFIETRLGRPVAHHLRHDRRPLRCEDAARLRHRPCGRLIRPTHFTPRQHLAEF